MKWERGTDFDAYPQTMKNGLSKGLALAAEHILSVSDQSVPIEEGTLSRSGEASTDGLNSVVAYDTEYAVYQHEDLTYRHDAGRSAKFLENAFNTESKKAAEIIARTARGGS